MKKAFDKVLRNTRKDSKPDKKDPSDLTESPRTTSYATSNLETESLFERDQHGTHLRNSSYAGKIDDTSDNSTRLTPIEEDINKDNKSFSLANNQLKEKAKKILNPKQFFRESFHKKTKKPEPVGPAVSIESDPASSTEKNSPEIQKTSVFKYKDNQSINSRQGSLSSFKMETETLDFVHSTDNLSADVKYLESRFSEFTNVVENEFQKIIENIHKLNAVMQENRERFNDRLNEHDDYHIEYINKINKLQEVLSRQQKTIDMVDNYFGNLERKWGGPILKQIIPVLVFLLVALSAIWSKIGHRQFILPAFAIFGLWILKKMLFG